MNRVNIATLKEKLSHYLKLVQSGQEIVVTSHKQAVAKILPLDGSDIKVREPLRAASDLRKLKGVKRRRSVSAVRTLVEDRRAR